MTIQELKNRGFEVDVCHARPIEGDVESGAQYFYSRKKGFYSLSSSNTAPTTRRVANNGGTTIVTIRGGNLPFPIQGRAECSCHDNFCYKMGREIALGRALKKLEKIS